MNLALPKLALPNLGYTFTSRHADNSITSYLRFPPWPQAPHLDWNLIQTIFRKGFFVPMKCSPADAHDADVAIYLDYGVDCSLGYFGDLVISERGMIFRSRWRFRLGTQLALRVCAQARGAEEFPVCEELTGLVVSCEPYYGRSSLFEVTVLFLEVPEPVQMRIDRLATRPELMGNLN